MFPNIRQKIADLLINQTNGANSSNAPDAPQKSLLRKLSGVITNVSGSGAAATQKKKPRN